MKEKTLLIDTSALISLIQRKINVKGHAILDLTLYELGNVLRKEVMIYKTITKEELDKLLKSLEIILSQMRIIRISHNNIKEICEIAIKNSLTFYDAAYIFYAKKENLILVTDDEAPYKIAKKYVKTLRSDEIKENLEVKN